MHFTEVGRLLEVARILEVFWQRVRQIAETFFRRAVCIAPFTIISTFDVDFLYLTFSAGMEFFFAISEVMTYS